MYSREPLYEAQDDDYDPTLCFGNIMEVHILMYNALLFFTTHVIVLLLPFFIMCHSYVLSFTNHKVTS